MRCSVLLGAGLLSALAGSSALADSLRCEGASASVGDSRLAVLHACGQPLLADAFCEAVQVIGPHGPYPLLASPYTPCLPVEEWLYDRGPGNLMATVRFRNGKVQSIRYGQNPRPGQR